MSPIKTTETEIIISYEAAIALYRAGFLDAGMLGYCLPIAIAEEQCPEVLRDTQKIQAVSELLENLKEN